MPHRPPPTDADAIQRARAWLDRQHDRATSRCCGYRAKPPTEPISQALGQLSTGELRTFSRHLTTATNDWLGPPPPEDAGDLS
jgi:hypothetical protein